MQTVRRKTNVMIPDLVFGALVFVFVEIMFYSALLSSFVVMRRGRDSWGQSDAIQLPTLQEGFNGFVLALSLGSLLLALRSFTANSTQARGHLVRAFGLSCLFFLYQIVLGWKLWALGVTLTSSVFAGCLYIMLGSHLLQAIMGAMWIAKLMLSKENSAATIKGLSVLWSSLLVIWVAIYAALFF